MAMLNSQMVIDVNSITAIIVSVVVISIIAITIAIYCYHSCYRSDQKKIRTCVVKNH